MAASGPRSLSLVASELRDSDVGDTTIDDEFAYICSCRNAKSLREMLAAFIDLGEVSRDAPSLEHESGAGPTLRGRSRIGKTRMGQQGSAVNIVQANLPDPTRLVPAGTLQTWVRMVETSESATRLQGGNFQRGVLGNFALGFGRAPRSARRRCSRSGGRRKLHPDKRQCCVSVSVLSRPPRIEMMSQLVSEVDSSQELLSSLNRINGLLHFAKSTFTRPTVRYAYLANFWRSVSGGSEDCSRFLRERGRPLRYEIAAMFGGRLARLDNLDDEQLT